MKDDVSQAVLRRALAQQVSCVPSAPDEHSAALHHLVVDLERRLAFETRRCVVLTERLASYDGGRTHHIAQLRAIAERSGVTFIHHDGGIEHHLNLLAGLASQADLVVFPLDCISHNAAQLAKQLCRQAGKPFIPLRSASATSLLAALRRPEVTVLADAAN